MGKWGGGRFLLVGAVVVWGLAVTGCAGKRVAASSADADSTTKETGVVPIESVTQDPMATVPDDRRANQAIGRSSLDEPLASSRSAESAAVRQPSGPAGAVGSPATGESGLGDIFFDFDQYLVRRDAQTVLQANALWLKNAGSRSITIEGHCDERGTEAYNLVLGEKRARSTKRYLEDLGVPGSRMKVTSFGEVRPFCRDRTEECYQLNRRSHFVVQ